MADTADNTVDKAASVHDPETIEALLGVAVEGLGGTARSNQVAMTRAVTEAFANHRHLAVQAGTGTGKSLAYLVPSIVLAIETDEPVIVSTATIALQRQLVERDLPRLAESLGPHLKRTPTFAIQKGRANYLCLSKVNKNLPDPAPSDPDSGDLPAAELELDSTDRGFDNGADSAQTPSQTGAEVLKLRRWASETDTGDRADLTRDVSNAAWRQVSSTANDCVGAINCSYGEECFAERARVKAAHADIVVTNHALLAIDALVDAPVLPGHDYVVIDEAHELVDRITSVATDQLNPAGIIMAARRTYNYGGEDKIDDVVDAAEFLADTVKNLARAHSGALTAIPHDLDLALASLRDSLWQLLTALNTSSTSGGDSDKDAGQTQRAAIENLHDAVVRVQEFSDDDVVWLAEDKSIYVAPLSVSELLGKRLFGLGTVVLTSATLALGGSFDAMAASWGLPAGSWDGLDVGTPFEPRKSGILYVGRNLPRPGRDGASPEHYDAMEALIRAAGGRTLGLFSSRRAAEQAAAEMRTRLPYDVLCQGDDSIGNLVDRFAADPATCLFGTLTLWQGVDVPGPSLSLVIIDRIPFPRPDDPLMSSRAAAADAAGRSGFMEISAAHAALLMAQGSGRLLRSVNDRGVVAVLDPRLVTARYGSWIAASMPNFWLTYDLQVTTNALKRLVQGD